MPSTQPNPVIPRSTCQNAPVKVPGSTTWQCRKAPSRNPCRLSRLAYSRPWGEGGTTQPEPSFPQPPRIGGSSELKSQRELHLARRSRSHRRNRRNGIHCVDDAAEPCRTAGRRRSRNVASSLRLTQLRMIEDVVSLRPEFQPPAVRNRKCLVGRHIDLPRARPGKQIARRGTELSGGKGKGRRIDPLRYRFAPRRSQGYSGDPVGTPVPEAPSGAV